MAFWNTRGLRGNELEEWINRTNELYLQKGLGLIQKIPTPIKPIRIDKEQGVISLAYFEQKSTVDYIGIVQGVAICFDAKETTKTALPLSNIHQHQIVFMENFIKQGGEAFFIVYFKKHDTYFLTPFEHIKVFYDQALQGGRKSIPYEAFDKNYTIAVEGGLYLNYIQTLAQYLQTQSK
jgi:recombination protein U